MTYMDAAGIFGATLTLILHYVQVKNKDPTKDLTFKELQNSHVLPISKELSGKIQNKFGDLEVINLFVLKIKVESLGLPIKRSDLTEPIELSFDKEFLECTCIENPKHIDVVLSCSDDNKKEYCSFNLMTPHDYFTLQFVSLQKLSTPRVNFRVDGLSKVDFVSRSNRDRSFSKMLINHKMIKKIAILVMAVVFFGALFGFF